MVFERGIVCENDMAPFIFYGPKFPSTISDFETTLYLAGFYE